MRTPLSIHNLLEGGWRTVLSVVGISIAIVLIFMQLGFLGAVCDTAVLFYNNLKFDLVVRSPDYFNFVDSSTFDRRVFDQLNSDPEVERIEPFHVSLGKWTLLDTSKQTQRGILILGVDATGQPFQNEELSRKIPQVANYRKLLIDTKSRSKFLGPDKKNQFDEEEIGLEVELNAKKFTIADLFRLGTGLAADGAVVIDEIGFTELYPNYHSEKVGLGLIQLKPGVDPRIVQARLQNKFEAYGQTPSAVQVVTREEVLQQETDYWMYGTPLGFIFIAGVVVAFAVGAIIVYIVLSSDIANQIGEYATLKAMGFRNIDLARIVLEQAIILAVISYALAFGITLILYFVVGALANLPITMTLSRQLVVFASSILMSCVSGGIAMQKLRNADPADLF